jgi:DNA-binding response OmpR family regulator
MIEGRPRIFAVEDDAEAAEQLVEFLSMSGYQIDLAADGNEGSRNDD